MAGDTGGIEQGIGSFASRAAVVGGSAVALAARDVRAKAQTLAARVLGVPEDEIQQDGPAFAHRHRPERRTTFAELARAAAVATAALGVEPGLESTRFFQPPDIAYSSGAHVVLVEVDPASAVVQILGYWISHDSGRLINPMVVDGQIQGGAALGIGGALLEEITYDAAGQPRAASFMDYLLPTALDVPRMAIDHFETLSPLNPLGIKGVGESGTLPVTAALASAIEDAIGRPILHMPVTPARLHALLASGRRAKALGLTARQGPFHNGATHFQRAQAGDADARWRADRAVRNNQSARWVVTASLSTIVGSEAPDIVVPVAPPRIRTEFAPVGATGNPGEATAGPRDSSEPEFDTARAEETRWRRPTWT